jgi:hypothetical protein
MMTSTATAGSENLTVTIEQEIFVKASLAVTFDALLEQLGPENSTPERPMPMKLEAWPGGRWYRDLGDNNGHFWGHVQAIKRPTLLEITGPLFMSYAAVSNLQYRLSEEDGGTAGTRCTRASASGPRPRADVEARSFCVEEESMCPACMASAALMAGSVMSTGGIAALAVRVVRGKKLGEEENSQNAKKNDEKEK